MSETRTDRYGRQVTFQIENGQEVYSTYGMVVRFPLGAGWGRALHTIEAHIPVGMLEEDNV